jgi:hypothetical protein
MTITTQDTIFAIVAILYGIAGIFLLYYTDKVSKQIKQHEEEHKARRNAKFARHHDKHHSECDHELWPSSWKAVKSNERRYYLASHFSSSCIC